MAASTRRLGGRVDGMANESELPSEAPLRVTSQRYCALKAEGLNQKVRDQEWGSCDSLIADVVSPAYRQGLTHLGIDAEHGKPVFLPSRESEPEGEPIGVRVTHRGESEGRSLMGRIRVWCPARK